ncbi:hypothetical protein DFH08DRAFT_437528 [Mycena albidolilacea]|uniref:F-box domain-containing protein n=1 Tax=Mycena albidolilacea TaxID=1033008 RepID=A0AAD7AGJ9_9AGAR|nr:hypothetical protein DFH08DRAFT_437528 [Mycena albidolilacea]
MLESCWQCGAAGTPPEAATGSLKSPPSLAPHRLLTSNDVPLDSETPFIRGIVSEGQNQVDALNSQIENMEAAILRLTRKRDALAEHVHQHRAILAPVRRVPPELVGEILALSLPSDNRPPWHLAHICRFWRHCMLGYPALWNSITIPFSSPPDLLPMIETQLIRSVNAPLNIFWSAFEDEDTPDLRAAALIVSHSNRWRALLLDNSYYSIQLNWLHAANGRLATLETLQVRGKEIEIPDIFSAAPSLCKVFLTNWYFGASAPVSAIPWAQFTHYAGSFTADVQVEIVKKTPNLVSCAIGFPDWVNSFAPGDPAVLPRLQRLCIEMAGFLPRLEAPLLQELYCSYSGWLQGRSEILPFVERSACLLQNCLSCAAPSIPTLSQF